MELKRTKNTTKKIITALLLSLPAVLAYIVAPLEISWTNTGADGAIYSTFIPKLWPTHPGGAPAYVLSGWLWLKVFSEFEPYHALVLYSAVGLLVTTVFAFFTARLYTGYAASVGLAISVGGSLVLFSQAMLAESYPFVAALLAVFVWLIASFEKTKLVKVLYWSALPAALLIGTHHAGAVIVGLTYWLLFMRHGEKTSIIKVGLLSGLGLLLYLYVPLRWAAMDYSPFAGETLHDLRLYFSSTFLILTLPMNTLWERIVEFAPTLGVSVLPFLPVLISGVVFSLFYSKKRVKADVPLLCAGLYLVYVLGYLVPDGYVYLAFIPVLLVPWAAKFYGNPNTYEGVILVMASLSLLGLNAFFLQNTNDDAEKLRAYLQTVPLETVIVTKYLDPTYAVIAFVDDRLTTNVYDWQRFEHHRNQRPYISAPNCKLAEDTPPKATSIDPCILDILANTEAVYVSQSLGDTISADYVVWHEPIPIPQPWSYVRGDDIYRERRMITVNGRTVGLFAGLVGIIVAVTFAVMGKVDSLRKRTRSAEKV